MVAAAVPMIVEIRADREIGRALARLPDPVEHALEDLDDRVTALDALVEPRNRKECRRAHGPAIGEPGPVEVVQGTDEGCGGFPDLRLRRVLGHEGDREQERQEERAEAAHPVPGQATRVEVLHRVLP